MQGRRPGWYERRVLRRVTAEGATPENPPSGEFSLEQVSPVARILVSVIATWVAMVAIPGALPWSGGDDAARAIAVGAGITSIIALICAAATWLDPGQTGREAAWIGLWAALFGLGLAALQVINILLIPEGALQNVALGAGLLGLLAFAFLLAWRRRAVLGGEGETKLSNLPLLGSIVGDRADRGVPGPHRRVVRPGRGLDSRRMGALRRSPEQPRGARVRGRRGAPGHRDPAPGHRTRGGPGRRELRGGRREPRPRDQRLRPASQRPRGDRVARRCDRTRTPARGSWRTSMESSRSATTCACPADPPFAHAAPIPTIIPPMNGGELIRSVGLMPDGPAVLGRPTGASAPGVYVVELASPLGTAPLDMVRVGLWIERVPGLRLNGERPTSKQLAGRLGGFWLPSQTVVFVASSSGTVSGRLRSLDAHVLGDAKPHAAAQWLKALRPDVVDRMRVWWAATDAPEEYEDALLEAFGESVAEAERKALTDATVVLPWANQRRPSGDRRQSGLTNATLPIEREPAPPPTTLVDVPPGDADGVAAARNTGTVRRTNAAPPPQRPPARARAASPPRPRTAKPPPLKRPSAPPVQLTADGLARLRAELDELTKVRRPQVVERIARARELGDLKENAEYSSAREEQSFLEGRVQALEELLRNAVVVAVPSDANRVVLGSKVRTEILDEEIAFEIVGSSEANAGAGRISDVSPVGRALIGRSVGDEAIVMTPRGEARYRIVAIE